MSESKSFSMAIMKWRISGQGCKHLTRFSRFVLFKAAASTMQKISPVSCKSLSLKVCLYTFISRYLKKIIKIGFPELEKISPTISLFFRKMIALVLKFSYAKRFKD